MTFSLTGKEAKSGAMEETRTLSSLSAWSHDAFFMSLFTSVCVYAYTHLVHFRSNASSSP